MPILVRIDTAATWLVWSCTPYCSVSSDMLDGHSGPHANLRPG
jgi:hypothetical protein